MRRVIFLGIDGVLNHGLHPRSGPARDPRDLDLECVRRLRVVAHAADIVLCGSWPLAVAVEVLSRYDVALADAADEDRLTASGRPRAILTWVAAHRDVDSWVVLADDWMGKRPRDPSGAAFGIHSWRHVRTDSAVGLSDRDADVAQVVLYENRPAKMPAPGAPHVGLPCDRCGKPAVYVDDHSPQIATRYGCVDHGWPALGMIWRAVVPSDRLGKRGRYD